MKKVIKQIEHMESLLKMYEYHNDMWWQGKFENPLTSQAVIISIQHEIKDIKTALRKEGVSC